jgi:hypothetical protein
MTNSAHDSITTPDYILNPEPIDAPGRPSAPVKRDPNSLVKFYIPEAPASDGEEETGDLDKRFYIYHRPPLPGAEPTEPGPPSVPVKRDPNSLVNFWIPEAPAPDGEEETAGLDKRFYIYHRPPPPGAAPLDEESDETIEKRDLGPEWISDPKSIDKLGQPSAPVKRDPNSFVNFWTPEAPADE